jgi:toxin ParE1/3/4
VTPVFWTTPARRDIDRIAADLADIDPAVASATIVAIRASSWRLRDFPLSAPAVGHAGLRKLSVTGAPYLLLYRVRDGSVEIIRVRHARENWLP